jgi:phage gpG-like protein
MSTGLNLRTQELKKFLHSAPRQMGRILVDEFMQNFRRQGYINRNGVFIPWRPRKKEQRARYGTTGKRRLSRKDAESRAILVKSGALRRDIRVKAVTTNSVTIVNTMPYAKRHNEGLKGMPKRPFMIESKKANDQIKKLIETNIKKIFR